MSTPLMPKSTSVWVVENTSLTFEQISKFCNLHILEIQGIADGEVAVGIRGKNPIMSGELSKEEIKKCEEDPSKNLEITSDERYIFAKNSFDQWSLLYLVEKDYKKILKFIENLNSNDEILASDYSYGQVYFEITGKNSIKSG